MIGPSIVDRCLQWRKTIIVVFAVATRLITFGNPILYTDEEFYFAVGRAMVNGALPFVDIWDRKPVGLFLIYALPASLPGLWGIWAYQAMALVSVVATSLIIARLADAAGWHRGSILAGIAYLAWITIAGGQGGQSPVFYNLAVAMAAWMIIHRESAVTWRAPTAMLLLGLAIQIKYTVALEGAYFGLWLCAREWRTRRSVSHVIRLGASWAMLALVPTMLVMIAYASLGELQAFVYANFQSIFSRNSDTRQQLTGNIGKALAILLPLVGMALGARTHAREHVAGARLFLVGWLLAALLAFAVLPPWTDHYTLSVMLPASVMTAGLLARPAGRRLGIALTILALLAGQVSLVIDLRRRGTPEQFAKLARMVGHGPGCLYVYSSTSMLYPATGRCALSSYVFPSHLTRDREAGAVGVDQMSEMRSIFAKAPEVVVMGPPYPGERADIRATALSLVARDYKASGFVLLGRKEVVVYRRIRAQPATPPSAISSRFSDVF